MEELLHTYLLHRQSVSLPGLGTIYIERVPAQSDFVNRSLIPPGYRYRFDQYFDAPGKDFFTFIASRKNIPEYEAIKTFNEWAQQLRNSIGTDQPASIAGIGLLSRDGSGTISFEPTGEPRSYYVPVQAERVIRDNASHAMLVGDKETNTAAMTGYLQEEVHKERESWWIYALILAAAAATAIFFHYYRNGAALPFGNHQTIQVK